MVIQRIIVDVSGIYEQNTTEGAYIKGAYINEIKLYDKNNALLPYVAGEAFSSDNKGNPVYWEFKTILGKYKLNDAKTVNGNDSSTFLELNSDESYCRFVLELTRHDIETSRVEVFLGDPNYNRTPKKIDFYTCENYSLANLKERDNTGLTKVATIETKEPLKTSTSFNEYFLNTNKIKKYLFSKSNTTYTIENGTLKSLGTITTANASTLFESGVEAITKEHCVLVGQQLGKAKVMWMLV